MKSFLRRIKNWFIFQRECYLDGRRYLLATPWAGRIQKHSLAHLESDIVRRYHVIEKGLTMPDFRPRFGEDMIRQLVRLLLEWQHRPDCIEGDADQIMAARATVESYRNKHASMGIDVNDLLGPPWHSGSEHCGVGGTQPFVTVNPNAVGAFHEVVRSRVSVRNYDTDKAIDQHLIEKAVEVAIRAPSVCNRQTWRVHQYHGARAQEVLSLQNGNRGFGHTIPCILVITSDLRYFTATSERYQAWIDGGMFAMLTLLGLHAQGLGAVALNWSVMNQQDEKLRTVGKIPDYERIIMLIGCGHPATGIVVPKSRRRSVSSILTVHP